MDLLPKRGGSKPEYSEKTPDHQSKNRDHILKMNVHCLNLHPVILVISSLGQSVPVLTIGERGGNRDYSVGVAGEGT